MDLIILGIVAVFLVFRLFSMIGQDLGGNMDAFKQDAENLKQPPQPKTKTNKPEIVAETEPTKPADSLTAIIEKISAEYPDFNYQNFINGAAICFKNTVENFAKGNKPALKELLTPTTYKVFAQVVDKRIKNGEVAKDEVIGFVKIEVVAFKTTAKSIEVEVEFVSDQINVVFDSADRIVEGHPNDIVRITDNWVFSRQKQSTELNWYVKETS